MKKTLIYLLLLIFQSAFIQAIFAQPPISNSSIKEQIKLYKNDVRGVYKSIRWFCDDGTIKMPNEPCTDEIGGIQHATYKDEVEALGRSNHIFLGQILAYTDKLDFWDEGNNHSRLKQYQLGRYLARIDNGWVNQKGQFYRGAIQIEDEENWGVKFYKSLLSKDNVIKKNYYLLLQSVKDIPHKGDDNIAQLMRSQSKVISDQYSKFMDLRIKIHSNPEPIDIENTIQFKKENSAKLSTAQSVKIDELIVTMQKFHKPIDVKSLADEAKKLDSNSYLTKTIKTFIKEHSNTNPSHKNMTIASAKVLLTIRKDILKEKSASQRFILIDIANQLEAIVFKEAGLWKPDNLMGILDKIYVLSMAISGTGGIELWEWERIETFLQSNNEQKINLEELTKRLETARSAVEWSSAMVKATYQHVVNLYAGFEEKAYGFIDNRIRASLAFQLGKSVEKLGVFIAKESSLTNKVLNLNNQSTIRGLNPGYAFGELVVVSGVPDDINVSGNKIYIFERRPSDLKPVAGIAIVAEGNLVSHVQLLARNLGIPNAVLSDENLKDLKAFNGKKVFYAVSNKGNVILKLENSMTANEKALFSKKIRKEDKIAVPVKEIRLDQNNILNLRDINAKDSGKLCGPKAANLGQLKEMFPDKVVEGFVIPFGIFREHMEQPMSGQNKSYWNFLTNIFTEAENKRNQGIPENEVENFQLKQLGVLREAIKKMQFKPEFINDIEKSFVSYLKKPIGSIPVFLRSDTNMEDLKDFTGAGLNLTIFNVLQKEKIMQGIKDVWASPYTERSFKWRQKYLLNPENVFPSILVIPSVDVDYSGVLITKGIISANENELTIAFSRGAGGAVDGQAAEAYLIKQNGNYDLISPAREAYYKTLPITGSTVKKSTTFEKPMLNNKNIKDIIEFAGIIRKTLSRKTKSNYRGAYDVELGFKNDKLWLFQIRPFVENKNALGSEYLESITPKIAKRKEIVLTTKL